jgi:hypothetical protein
VLPERRSLDGSAFDFRVEIPQMFHVEHSKPGFSPLEMKRKVTLVR